MLCHDRLTTHSNKAITPHLPISYFPVTAGRSSVFQVDLYALGCDEDAPWTDDELALCAACVTNDAPLVRELMVDRGIDFANPGTGYGHRLG